MNAVKSIVLPNVFEFNNRVIYGTFPEDELDLWRQTGHDLADMGLFWCGDDKLVITPEPLEAQFVSDVCAAMGYRNVHVLSPAVRSDAMCDDIQSDPAMFALLVDTIRNSENPQIISWGATLPLYRLVERLRGLGLTFQTPELPAREDYWTSVYFDSKAGFRELCQRLGADHPEIKIPEGFLCSHREDALEVASYFTRQGRDFILKASHGVGGFGTFLSTGRESDKWTTATRASILERLAHDHIWDTGPIVVEEFIHRPLRTRIGDPTVDFVIHQDGRIEVIGVGVMIVDESYYLGVEIGREVLPPDLAQSLIRIGSVVGELMAELGYRGWYDIDFLISVGGQLYLSEINARRTSPTHIFEIARRFLGDTQPQHGAVVANDYLIFDGIPAPTYGDIRRTFLEFNHIWNRTMNVIAVPTITSSLVGNLAATWVGLAVVASDLATAQHARSKLESEILRLAKALA